MTPEEQLEYERLKQQMFRLQEALVKVIYHGEEPWETSVVVAAVVALAVGILKCLAATDMRPAVLRSIAEHRRQLDEIEGLQ